MATIPTSYVDGDRTNLHHAYGNFLWNLMDRVHPTFANLTSEMVDTELALYGGSLDANDHTITFEDDVKLTMFLLKWA